MDLGGSPHISRKDLVQGAELIVEVVVVVVVVVMVVVVVVVVVVVEVGAVRIVGVDVVVSPL
jgi:hypothetical protein